MALEFANTGYNIILHGRKQSAEFRKVLEQIKKIGAQTKTIFADLSTSRGLSVMKKCINSAKPDILINNAAIYQDENILRQVTVNLVAPITLANCAAKVMNEKGGGTIININSMAGKVPNAKESVYCASKFGLRGYSESVKYGLLKQNIRMIDLYPGAINTGISSHREDREKLIDPEEFAQFVCNLTHTKSFMVHVLDLTRVRY